MFVLPGIPAGQEEGRGRGIPGIDSAGPAGTEAEGPREARAGSEPGEDLPGDRAGEARSTAGAGERTEGRTGPAAGASRNTAAGTGRTGRAPLEAGEDLLQDLRTAGGDLLDLHS